jgi:hypothetical protein
MKRLIEHIFYFFPVQLIFIQFRRNFLLLFSWIFLFAVISGNFGSAYGVDSLYLIPEYLNKISIFSYFLLGISFGIFIMAYQISGYVSTGYLFPFLSTLRYPFWKYSINNSAIPILFILYYIYKSCVFQKEEALFDSIEIIKHTASFISGILFFIVISFIWFFSSDINISKYAKKEGTDDAEKSEDRRNPKILKKIIEKDSDWKMYNTPDEKGRFLQVRTYFVNPFKIKRARLYGHYPSEHIQNILRHNYKNGLIFSFAVLTVILASGIFKDTKEIIIPAASSINILLSLFIMMSAVFFYFFKDWSFIVFAALILLINIISKESSIKYHQSAYGLNYSKNIPVSDSLTDIEISNQINDYYSTLNILNKRVQRNKKLYKKRKPSLIFVNTCGGGLRSALLTYTALHYADSLTDGKFLDHTQLITGASGGMLGAAFQRELYLKYKKGEIKEWYNDSLCDAVSKDILNPVAFTFATGDWFFRFQKFIYNKQTYYKDRAYIWEKTFNQNTYGFLDKSLSDYKEPEESSLIPMMIFSPADVDKGRKILISPQNISYFENLSFTGLIKNRRSAVNIDFRKMYKEFDADSLRFLSAIRMSSTFPYITPFVELPGENGLKIIDAGLHDNYGLSTSLEFISIFKEWLKKNTGKIIIVQILYKDKINRDHEESLLSSVISPFSGAVENFFSFQQMNFEKQLMLADNDLKKKIVFCNIIVESEKEVSISWRLTEQEKRIILKGNKFRRKQKDN